MATDPNFSYSNRRTKITVGVTVAILALLLVLGSCGSNDDPPTADAPATTSTSTTTAEQDETTTTAADPFAAQRVAMRDAVDDEDWDKAISLADEIGDTDARRRYRRSAARRLLVRARSYERRGRAKTANRLARRARSTYGAQAAAGSTRLIGTTQATIDQ